MKGRQVPKRCTAAGCGQPAVYAFLAVTGDHADRIVDETGVRVRSCQGCVMGISGKLRDAMQALPGGGPARLRAVPLLPA
jgi:hypothetical protein